MGVYLSKSNSCSCSSIGILSLLFLFIGLPIILLVIKPYADPWESLANAKSGNQKYTIEVVYHDFEGEQKECDCVYYKYFCGCGGKQMRPILKKYFGPIPYKTAMIPTPQDWPCSYDEQNCVKYDANIDSFKRTDELATFKVEDGRFTWYEQIYDIEYIFSNKSTEE